MKINFLPSKDGHLSNCSKVGRLCQCESRGYLISLRIAVGVFVLALLGGLFTRSLSLTEESFRVWGEIFALHLGHKAAIAKNDRVQADKKGGFWTGIILIAVSIFMLHEAHERFMHDKVIKGMGVLVISAIMLVANIFQIFLIARIESINAKKTRIGILFNIVSESIYGLFILIIGILVFYKINWAPKADAVLAFIIFIILLRVGIKLSKEGGKKIVISVYLILTFMKKIPVLNGDFY